MFQALLDKIAWKEFSVEYTNGIQRTFVTAPKNIQGKGMNIKANYVLYEKNGDKLTEIATADTREELMRKFEYGID